MACVVFYGQITRLIIGIHKPTQTHAQMGLFLHSRPLMWNVITPAADVSARALVNLPICMALNTGSKRLLNKIA